MAGLIPAIHAERDNQWLYIGVTSDLS